GGAIPPQRQVVEVLANEDDLLGAGEDAQLTRASELECELAEHFVAETVERLDRGVVQAKRRIEVDALLHPRRGLLGEGERKDLVWLRRAGRDQVNDARGEHVRLPRPRPGDDEQGPGAVFDRA